MYHKSHLFNMGLMYELYLVCLHTGVRWIFCHHNENWIGFHRLAIKNSSIGLLSKLLIFGKNASNKCIPGGQVQGDTQHIEVGTIWPMFAVDIFNCIFLKHSILIRILLKCFSLGPSYNKPVWVHQMAPVASLTFHKKIHARWHYVTVHRWFWHFFYLSVKPLI